MYIAMKMRKMKNRTNENTGFTLVELLVVISIIALLLAVLLPALGKARKLAQRVVCTSRIQQLTLSGMVYSQNNNGKFPHQYADRLTNHMLIKNPLSTTDPCAQDSWVKHIHPYIKNLAHYRCPGNNNIDDNYKPTETDDISYTCNGVVAHFGGANLKRPSETVAYYENPERGNISVLRPFFESTSPTEIAQMARLRYWTGWMRYSNGALHPQGHDNGKDFTFLDGHVEYAKWQKVTSLWFRLLISRKYIDGQEPQVNGYRDDSRTAAIKW